MAGKLRLACALMILSLVVGALVSYRHMGKLQHELTNIVTVETPVERAMVKMGTDAAQTARSVLGYARNLDPMYLGNIEEAATDFRHAADEFERLAKTEQVRRLGNRVIEEFGELGRLGDRIVALADRRQATIKRLSASAADFDQSIHKELRPTTSRVGPGGQPQFNALLVMDLAVHRALAAIQGYLVKPDQALRRNLESAVADFQDTGLARRQTAPDPGEAGVLDGIGRDFAQIVKLGTRAMAISDEIEDRLNRLDMRLATIALVLEGEIQALIQARNIKAADNANRLGRIGAAFFMLLTVLALPAGIAVTWAMARAFSEPVRTLVEGTDIVGGGNLGHRIAIDSADEFGRLATAFNRMLDKLESSAALLRDKEARLRVVLETAADGIVAIDERGTIESFNRMAERMFGYAAEEVIGKNVSILMPTPHREAHDGYLRSYRETGAPNLIGTVREQVAQRRDGTTFPIDLAVAEAKLGGRTIFTGIVRDITARRHDKAALHEAYDALERRVQERTAELERANADLGRHVAARQQAEAALVQSEARFRDFAELGSDWFWEMDANLSFSYFSQDMIPGTGISLLDRLGMKREELALPEDDPEKWRQHLETIRARKPFRDFTYCQLDADGRTVYLRNSGTPLFDADGNFRGYRGTGSNVTQEMETMEALRAALGQAELANRTKSQFLANMSHELRTPLNAIIGFSEIIKNEQFGPIGGDRYRDYATDINESGQHLLELISEILDLSKIESGKDELFEQEIEIEETARIVRVLFSDRAARAGVKLVLDYADDLPALRADPRKLKQVLVNLLSNAVKFTPSGGSVTFRAWCRSDSGYVFQVIDTGIGIAVSDIPKAFSPFSQIESELSRKYAGTGLGLPLAKALIEMHGASLDLQSEVGVGTTVTVRFPAARIADADVHKRIAAG